MKVILVIISGSLISIGYGWLTDRPFDVTLAAVIFWSFGVMAGASIR